MDAFINLWKDWDGYKKEAVETKDYDFYLLFLRETQVTFTELYSESKMKETIELEESVLKQITHEINWANGKKKEKEIPF